MEGPTLVTGADMAWKMCGHDEVVAVVVVWCGGAGVAAPTSCGAGVVVYVVRPDVDP